MQYYLANAVKKKKMEGNFCSVKIDEGKLLVCDHVLMAQSLILIFLK